MTPLIQKWRRDTSQAWDRRRLLAERSPTAPSESLRVTRALQLIADGEISRAQAAKVAVRGGLAFGDLTTAILAGRGAGAPRRKFWGYVSVELMFCHYADVSRLGT